jgi:hypothetical protein
MKVIRWLLLIPAAMLAALVASSLASFSLSLAHGFGYIHHLLVEANDMAGRPIDGTVCLLLYRGFMGAASTYAVMLIAPTRKLVATYVWFAILLIGSLALLAMLTVSPRLAGWTPTLGVGYRAVIEVIGLLGGSLTIILPLRRGEL